MLEINRKHTYLTMIRNSVGTRMFQSLFVNDNEDLRATFLEQEQANPEEIERLYNIKDGEPIDLLRKGQVSCAVFVSGLLVLNELIPHMTAKSVRLKELLRDNGWETTTKENMQPGDVIFWNKGFFSANRELRHVGFYIGNQEAVSNRATLDGTPRIHHYEYKADSEGERGIDEIFTHPLLK